MNKTLRFFAVSWLVIAGSAGSPTPCLADAAVTLNPEVQVTRFAVRLGDLFTGVPAGIDRDIAQSPPPCKSAVYDETVLNKLADTYRLDWQRQNAAADHAVVTSACARITADMIRDRIIAKITQTTTTTSDAAPQNGADNGRTYDITFDNRSLEIDLPLDGSALADVKPDFTLANFTYDQGAHTFSADLTAPTARGPYVAPVTGHVTVERPVPILAHRLESGDTISANDLDWVQIPEERISADVVTETSQLIGHELRRDKAEDEIFRSHDVVPQRLVLRGALVTMRIATPYMTVTTQGKAQQDGAQGDVIRVVNTQSNRVIEGVVTGPDIVEIGATQKIASAQ